MGCDGGTIPTRDELVRTKKKPEQKDKTSELAFKWKHCAISQEALVKPIVACELGRLYNKESVLELLLDRSKFDIAEQLEHLRGLKDVKELNLTDMPEKKSHLAQKGNSRLDSIVPDFICPVVGIEMSGKHRFCFLWSCGCVMSERALKEVMSETCHKCGKPVKEEDIVVMNGAEDDVVEMRHKMEQRRLEAKLAKKAKKAEKHKLKEAASSDSSSSPPQLHSAIKQGRLDGAPAPQLHSAIKQGRLDGAPASSKSVSFSTQSTEHKIGSKLLTQDPARREGKSIKTTNGANGVGNVDKKGKVKKTKIQDDPSGSKTYKSLFTSCDAAKNQQQPHWVTFNPQYF